MPFGEFNHWGIIRAYSPESNKRKYIVTITAHPTNRNIYLGLLISTRKDPAKTLQSKRKKYHLLARGKYFPPLYTDSFVSCDSFTQFAIKTVDRKFRHILQEDATKIKERVYESKLLSEIHKAWVLGTPNPPPLGSQ